MKIIIGQIAHETNTFSNVVTTNESFRQWEWLYGEEVLREHRHVKDYLGGMIDRGEEIGAEIIPVFSAFAMPSGIITKATFNQMKDDLIDGIQAAGEIDAVCLALHGAGIAENVDDMDGEILKAVRQTIGYEIPLVVTLDLHANVTDQMVREADVLLGVHLYPHVDSYERGCEAIDVAQQIVTGVVHPKMSLRKLPLLIPTSTTNISPARDINELCWSKERGFDKVIDCAFFHGFPYTDIPEIGVTVLTVTNNDQQLADRISEEIALEIWQRREAFFPKIDNPEEGIKKALALKGGPIIINETSDNPGGGTPGDGTYLLSAMLDANLTNACFGFIYDPETVQIAHAKGVGASIEVQLGGKTDNLHGEPIPVHAYVKALTDGQFIYSTPMWQGLRVNLGKSARLDVNGIDIIVCSKRSQTLDEQIFLLHGIDVTKYKIVALKSSQHFRAAFEPLAKAVISVDSLGLTTFNLENLNYKKFDKQVYPFKQDLELIQMNENK